MHDFTFRIDHETKGGLLDVQADNEHEAEDMVRDEFFGDGELEGVFLLEIDGQPA